MANDNSSPQFDSQNMSELFCVGMYILSTPSENEDKKNFATMILTSPHSFLRI